MIVNYVYEQESWLGLVRSASADSTNSKRKTSWRHWLNYIRDCGNTIQPINPTELEVCLWLVYLNKKKLAYSTIKVYLYALSSEVKLRGGGQVVKPHISWFIHTTLKAIQKRLTPSLLVYRRPLTIPLMEKLISSLDLKKHDNLLLGAMIAVGVYGMFRINELCYKKAGGVEKFIKNGDVKIQADRVTFLIYRTKTDPVVKKVIGRVTGARWDPWTLLKSFMNIKRTSWKEQDALFLLESGKPVTRAILVHFMQTKLKMVFPKIEIKEWNGISLRKGGATSAMLAGVPGEMIKCLGNWKSAVYERYIQYEDTDIISAQQKIGKAKVT